MKKSKAFLAALFLFAVTVLICHGWIRNGVARNNPAFSTWASESKSVSRVGLSLNMNEGTIPVFGSSEFQHGKDSAYHPMHVFEDNRFNPMLIGAGYYQALTHAVTLAAIEPSMIQRKAVLILSPQWFRKTGVVPQAYTSRFSEILYTGMLENSKLSQKTKQYISDRTHELLENDEKTLKHVKLHDQVLFEGESTFTDRALENLWNEFLKEKDYFQISAAELAAGIRYGKGIPEEESEPDWDALMVQAEAEGIVENTNEFFIDDTAYNRLLSVLETKKGMNSDAVKGYQTGPEYEDLRCFLDVCAELEIEPMIVIVPVNGYYYDYTEFPTQARQKYYENIRNIAAEYGVRVADFSDQEYTEYFFEDRVHIGKKGWVMVCESLYDFYREDSEN